LTNRSTNTQSDAKRKGADVVETHKERETHPWTIMIPDHPPREDSREYVKSRALMNKIAAQLPEWFYPAQKYQDHHGGGLWVKDAQGWLCVQQPLGIEWSAQFCADPVKVDRLRAYANRVVSAFPDTLFGYQELGYTAGAQLLATKITDAATVSKWIDSIFNASVPLPADGHTGVLPKGAGYHHYPKPIVDINYVRYDDYKLFVTDADGLPAVVVPVAPRGSGDGRVRLLAVSPESEYAALLDAPTHPDDDVHPTADDAFAQGDADAIPLDQDEHDDGLQARPSADRGRGDPILPADDLLAREAFSKQR
jgi:hypothetical protein